jgi:tetratricopeptide (TPR) repeat protein
MFKKTALLSIICLLIFCSSFNSVFGQNEVNDQYKNANFEKGLQLLRQGDTLAAYQYINTANTFSKSNEALNFYYHNLSLFLDKANAGVNANNWIQNSNNRIFKSKISYALGIYYFKHKMDEASLNAFSGVSIDDLDNPEIVKMKFIQGYLYFKVGNWAKAESLLNAVRQVKNNEQYTDANYYSGFLALEKKEFASALSFFQIASQNEAYSKLTPFYISQLYYFLGDYDKAMQQCENALNNKGQFYEIKLKQLMGHLLFEKKQYAKALPYLSDYVAVQKKVEPQDLYQLSFCYFQSQNWSKAIPGFKQLASEEDSLGQNSMYLLATSYLKIDDKNGAKNAFLICSSKSQNLSQKEISLFNYGKLCVELKEYSNGVYALDKFMTTYPKSLNKEEAKSLWITALTFSNNYIQALQAFESVEKPTTELLKIYPNILYGRATLYINEGEVEKAASLLLQVVNTPYNAKVLPNAQFWLGELSYKLGRIDIAIEYLEKFLTDPIELGEVSQRHAKYTLGYCYLKKGDYTKAISLFTYVANYNHANMIELYQQDAYLRLSDCQMMTKQFKTAIQSYQNVIDWKWGTMDYATLQKAIILGGLGQANEKIKILKDFNNQFRNSSYLNDANMELAETYTNQENFEAAIEPLSKVLIDKKATSYYPQAYYKLGIVYFNLNKNEAALQNFRELYTAYPNAIESENSIEFIRNIYIEDQKPELFVQFMNEFGKPLAINEQDSLTYRASIIKYEQKKYDEAAVGFKKYLFTFPNGEYKIEANNLVGEIAYAKQAFDSAVIYFANVADEAPNKYAERASLIASRLYYFNFKKYDQADKYFKILSKIATQQENKNEALKGILRCEYKNENWDSCAMVASVILKDKSASPDDILIANMALYHQSILLKDTSNAIQMLTKVIKSNSTLITAEAHYMLAKLYLDQQQLTLAEKTAFDVIKKHAAYELWVTKSYLLLGDIYVAQKDNFNAIATYKSVAENAGIEELKNEAASKLKLLVDSSNNK